MLQFVPGVRATLAQANSLGIRGGGNGLQFAVAGSDYTELATTAQKIADQMNNDPKFGRVTVNYSATTPELTLSIDRDKAAALGIDINGLSTTMQSMIDEVNRATIHQQLNHPRQRQGQPPVPQVPGRPEAHLLHALSGLRLSLLPGVEFLGKGDLEEPLPHGIDGAPL